MAMIVDLSNADSYRSEPRCLNYLNFISHSRALSTSASVSSWPSFAHHDISTGAASYRTGTIFKPVGHGIGQRGVMHPGHLLSGSPGYFVRCVGCARKNEMNNTGRDFAGVDSASVGVRINSERARATPIAPSPSFKAGPRSP